jgi:hypothetical protein
LARCEFLARRENLLLLGNSDPATFCTSSLHDWKYLLLCGRISARGGSDCGYSHLRSANIGKSSADVAHNGRARCLIRFISIKTAWDSMSSEEISHGAHGTTWVAVILPASINLRTILWLTDKRIDAPFMVRVFRSHCVSVNAGSWW